MFTQNEFSKNTLKALDIALSNGLSDYMFDYRSDVFRWNRSNVIAGNLFDLLDSKIFNGYFANNIICSYKMGLKEMSLAFVLCRICKNPYSSAVYNDFSVALDTNVNVLNAVLFLSKSSDMEASIDSFYLSYNIEILAT